MVARGGCGWLLVRSAWALVWVGVPRRLTRAFLRLGRRTGSSSKKPRRFLFDKHLDHSVCAEDTGRPHGPNWNVPLFLWNALEPPQEQSQERHAQSSFRMLLLAPVWKIVCVPHRVRWSTLAVFCLMVRSSPIGATWSNSSQRRAIFCQPYANLVKLGQTVVNSEPRLANLPSLVNVGLYWPSWVERMGRSAVLERYLNRT